MYSLFGTHILFPVFMSITLETVHVYNSHELSTWQPQIFYICKPYLFFHFYDPLWIPCLADIFLFPSLWRTFWNCIHVYIYKIVISVTLTTSIFYMGKPCLFLHVHDPLVFHVWEPFFANAYEVFTALHKHFTLKLYTFVYIQNTNAHKVQIGQVQIFYICKSYLFLHISDPLVFYVCPLYLFLYLPIMFSLQFENMSHWNCTHLYIHKMLMFMKY